MQRDYPLQLLKSNLSFKGPARDRSSHHGGFNRAALPQRVRDEQLNDQAGREKQAATVSDLFAGDSLNLEQMNSGLLAPSRVEGGAGGQDSQ
jgi:hypothetical protein